MIEEVQVEIESELIEQQEIRNVIGYLPGRKTDSLIVITAHYDHLGMMGEHTLFPGANDNASGVSAIKTVDKDINIEKIILMK